MAFHRLQHPEWDAASFRLVILGAEDCHQCIRDAWARRRKHGRTTCLQQQAWQQLLIVGGGAVTKDHGVKLKRSFRIRGLEHGNNNAYTRGLMIHSSTWVNRHCHKKYIPLHEVSCKGCVTVSTQGMAYLERLIANDSREILLWSYYDE